VAHGLQKKPVDFGYNPDHVTLGSGLEQGTVSGYGNLLYLSYSLHNYVPGRCLRSSRSNLLCVPSYKLNFGTRSFRALPRLLYGTHFLQTFVHVHFIVLLSVS